MKIVRQNKQMERMIPTVIKMLESGSTARNISNVLGLSYTTTLKYIKIAKERMEEEKEPREIHVSAPRRSERSEQIELEKISKKVEKNAYFENVEEIESIIKGIENIQTIIGRIDPLLKQIDELSYKQAIILDKIEDEEVDLLVKDLKYIARSKKMAKNRLDSAIFVQDSLSKSGILLPNLKSFVDILKDEISKINL